MPDIDNSRVIDSLKQRIAIFEIENGKIKNENVELKARIVKLEDKQTQNKLIKNLLSISQKLLGPSRTLSGPLRSFDNYGSHDQSLTNPLSNMNQFVILAGQIHKL